MSPLLWPTELKEGPISHLAMPVSAWRAIQAILSKSLIDTFVAHKLSPLLVEPRRRTLCILPLRIALSEPEAGFEPAAALAYYQLTYSGVLMESGRDLHPAWSDFALIISARIVSVYCKVGKLLLHLILFKIVVPTIYRFWLPLLDKELYFFFQ